MTRKSNPVETEVDLAEDPICYEEGEARSAIGSSCLYTVDLKTDGTGYSREVSLSQAVKPGEVDRFTFEVAAEKSSIHDLSLCFFYNRTESTIPEHIVLEIVKPKYV